MSERPYSYRLYYRWDDSARKSVGEWQITEKRGRSYSLADDPVVWSCPADVDGDGSENGEPPAALRAKYEELIGWTPPKEPPPSPANLVELIADGEDCAFDQPCAFGHRVEGHAVYCHNEAWLYSPRKCRRSQHDPEWTHDKCPGFSPNPKADPAKAW